MIRITNIRELKQGDRIFKIDSNGIPVFLEYVCPLPSYPSEYSLMVDQLTKNGAPKFYNKDLEKEEWYLYSENQDWVEIHQMEIQWHERQIAHLKERIEALSKNK